MGQLQRLDKMLALGQQVEERLEHQPLGQTTILAASLGVHRQNQEGYLVPRRLISQPPPPQALPSALEHQLGHQTACLERPALGEASSHPRAMPLHRISQLGLETLEPAPAAGGSLEPRTPLPIPLAVPLALFLAQLVSPLLQLARLLSLIHQLVQILW